MRLRPPTNPRHEQPACITRPLRRTRTQLFADRLRPNMSNWARDEASMKTTRSLWIATLLLMFGQLVSAQDLKGDWQGTLSLGPNRQLRLILRIDKASDTTWKA